MIETNSVKLKPTHAASLCSGTALRKRHLLLLCREKKGPPLFILPGTGGRTDGFKLLGRMFRDVCKVYGVEMMGTQGGETPLKTIQEVAAQNIQWIRQVQPNGPYRFAGHSFGAFVMYEMTRQLEQHHATLDFIAVLDQDLYPIQGISPPHMADFLMVLVRDYFESFKIISRPYPGWGRELRSNLEPMEVEAMVPYIVDFISQRIPDKKEQIEYFARLVNVRFFNDTMAYTPQGRIATHVIVLRTESNISSNPDQTLGWSRYADNVEVFTVPGNHHSLIRGRNAAAVSKCLKRRINHH